MLFTKRKFIHFTLISKKNNSRQKQKAVPRLQIVKNGRFTTVNAVRLPHCGSIIHSFFICRSTPFSASRHKQGLLLGFTKNVFV